MEQYDPYNPNDLDEILKEIKKKKDINDKKNNNDGNKIKDKNIGLTILRKMGWKGKGITI